MLISCFESDCESFVGDFIYKNKNIEVALLELREGNRGLITDIESKEKYIIQWEYWVDNQQLTLSFDIKGEEYLYTKLVKEPQKFNRSGAGVHRGFRPSCKVGLLERIYFDYDFDEHFFERI